MYDKRIPKPTPTIKKLSVGEILEKYSDPCDLTNPEDIKNFLGKLNSVVLEFGREGTGEYNNNHFPQFCTLNEIKNILNPVNITRIKIMKDRNKVVYERFSPRLNHYFQAYISDYDFSTTGTITARVSEVLERTLDRIEKAADKLMIELGRIEAQGDNIKKYWK